MADAQRKLANGKDFIDFQTDPSRYRHWKLRVDGDVATLAMDVDENGGLFEGYELKLNSYDLGVDIELADALAGRPYSVCVGFGVRDHGDVQKLMAAGADGAIIGTRLVSAADEGPAAVAAIVDEVAPALVRRDGPRS